MMRVGFWSVVTCMATAVVLAVVSQSIAQPAAIPPLSLRVETVSGTQAVLTDPNTGVQTTVQVGDVIQVWTVTAISSTGVELERNDPDQQRKVRAQLPAGRREPAGPSP
jgi:hypothetical protein